MPTPFNNNHHETFVELVLAAVRVERELDNAQPDVGMPPCWESLIERFANRLPGKFIPGLIVYDVLKALK